MNKAQLQEQLSDRESDLEFEYNQRVAGEKRIRKLENWLTEISNAVFVMQNSTSSQMIHEAEETIERVAGQYNAMIAEESPGILIELGHGVDVADKVAS